MFINERLIFVFQVFFKYFIFNITMSSQLIEHLLMYYYYYYYSRKVNTQRVYYNLQVKLCLQNTTTKTIKKTKKREKKIKYNK